MSTRHRSLAIAFIVLLLWHANVEATPRGSGRSSSVNPSVHKCCPPDQALVSGKGCIRSKSPASAYLTHLQTIMSVRVGFPVPHDQACEMMLLRRNVEHVAKWWISRAGKLAVQAPQGELAIRNYCIDDLIDPTTSTASPSAVTCVHELNGQVQLPHSLFRSRTVGKCCAKKQHFSRITQMCQNSSGGIPDWKVPVPGADNETQLGYTGFPTCQSGQYFTYYFNKKSDDEDHVRLASNLSLIVVSMDGQCIEKESAVSLKDYCFDYEWDGSGEAKPLAVMCVPPLTPELHPEKGPVLVVFLSISCIALLLTMAFLVALQAKGIVHHVPQSGPLAPRAHLTYVGTLFVGFLVLAIAVRQDVEADSLSCWATAGFLLFFLLAGFHWNTALCLESLLIIMRLGTPGWRRFLLHCVWAYGLPAIITIMALAMDANRTSLPCGTITIRVGRFTCFISDPDAKMLFFYLPILVTLVANLVLLGMGRHITNSRLRRLELGGAKHHKRHGSSGTINGKTNTMEDGVQPPEPPRRLLSSRSNTRGSNTSIARFGLGTRETHKLWLEAVCLAFWSGVTWFMEIIGFVITRYGYTEGGNWYEYLWYIPTVINSLRGLGVFAILVVLPKDSRSYLFELISNAYERCSGKPLRAILPSTRRSSTSTTTTATTTATASPVTPGDNERISLSSSDTQLSSHTESMSELREIPRQVEVSKNTYGVATVSTSLSTIPSCLKSARNATGRSSSDNRQSGKTNSSTDLENGQKLSTMRNSTGTLSGNYPKKTSDGFPVKPPRKSIDLSARAFLSVQNLSKPDGVPNEKNSNQTSSPNTPPKTPSPSSNPKTTNKLSNKIGPAGEVAQPYPDSSPDTPPESPPPSPPASPPPVVGDQSQEEVESMPVTKNCSDAPSTSSTLPRSKMKQPNFELQIPPDQAVAVQKVDSVKDLNGSSSLEKDSEADSVGIKDSEQPQEDEPTADEFPTSASSSRSRVPSPSTKLPW